MLIVGIILVVIVLVFLGFLLKKKFERASYITGIINKHPLKVAALCGQNINSLDNNSRAKILEFSSSDWDVWDKLIKALSAYQNKYSEVIVNYIEIYFPDVKKTPHYSNYRIFDPLHRRCRILIECLNFEQLNNLTSISENEWEKRQNVKRQAEKIKLANPDAIREIAKSDSNLSDEAIIKREKRLEEIQKRYNRAAAYEQWLETQKEFSTISRNLRDSYAKYCGSSTYKISFMKPLNNGETTSATFKIWQIFPHATSPFYKDFHNSLDFSLVTTLPEFKARTRYYLDSVYDDAIKYIKAVAENNKIIVLLNNRNSFDWSQETFNYHYSALITRLDDENIEWINVEELNNNVDRFQHNAALVFDFLTNNDSLKYISKMIIESFEDKIPNLVWYSMIKEYDESEMYELCKDAIETDKKKKEEEKAKKLKERIDEIFNKRNQSIEFVKSQLLRQNKHSFFSYFAIPNTLIGEAGGSAAVKAVWLSSPNTYLMKSKDKDKKGFICVDYSIDGGSSWNTFEIQGDYEDIDNVSLFTYELFKKMGILDDFLAKGAEAIDYMNEHRLLSHR